MSDKKLTGKIAKENIKQLSTPKVENGLLESFRHLGDASGVLSDVMDQLGITGVVGASVLRPTISNAVSVGVALTVRNVIQRDHVYETAKNKVNQMAEFEAHNLAQKDDFIVIQGVSGISNMGGISAQTGKRQGEVGAIVEGGIRDMAHSRAIGYPVWSTEITPVTGKWRIQTVEINGVVQICGVRVNCGDIVFADSSGVCFIPRGRAQEVLKLAQQVVKAEKIKCEAIDAGVAVPDLPKNA